MKLYGGFGSPFTRRVGVTLRLYNLDHEHVVLRGSVPEELAKLQKFNPLGRVPALETDDGRAITLHLRGKTIVQRFLGLSIAFDTPSYENIVADQGVSD